MTIQATMRQPPYSDLELTVGSLDLVITAHIRTAPQWRQIQAAITRVAERAEASALVRGLEPNICIIEAVDALVGFNSRQFETVVVSYRNA